MTIQPIGPVGTLQAIEGGGGLVATGLVKRYRKRPVVRGVSLSLKRGEAVGLRRGKRASGVRRVKYSNSHNTQASERA